MSTTTAGHGRKSHFLGTKLRALRKRNGLTLEDLSVRCIQTDPKRALSVSYLSMIESGKRVPSLSSLELLASMFQRPVDWFFDDSAELDTRLSTPRSGGAAAIPLEPAFLFSKELLQTAIPELLAQTGTTGRQFAQLLIRSYQESSRNDFPELERAAESIGERRFPLSAADMTALCKRHGLALKWFRRSPVATRDNDRAVSSMLRSFFESPKTIYLNESLRDDPARLKFDLASHLGHRLLHGGDGLKSPHATGGPMSGSPEGLASPSTGMNSQDVLHAWRDFECSFFAGALLCPKIPFRRFLAKEHHRVEACAKIGVTPAVLMRRMTKVSPYPYWHFFDAYPPGYLRAVYRGNGIPLPWGNMASATDPCPQWAVFRMLQERGDHRASQISVLRDGDQSLLYACHSWRTTDMAGSPHVISVGVDLLPALRSQTPDADDLVAKITDDCIVRHGEAVISSRAREAMQAVAKVLNIGWIDEAMRKPARIICSRSTYCPRDKPCDHSRLAPAQEISDLRAEILRISKRKGG